MFANKIDYYLIFNFMFKRSNLNVFRLLGPGILVTVGFIDPGNWASNIAAGSYFGYKLLWVVTLSTIMLIVLQHNVAHLGIVTGKCLSENSAIFLKPWLNKVILITATVAAIATALAEILGSAIALKMLTGINLHVGSVIVLLVVLLVLFVYSYNKLEKIIITVVVLIVLAFVIELFIIKINWIETAKGWVIPNFPSNSILVVMSVLGAVIMPHNLFLHSEIIQSKNYNTKGEETIKKRLKYEFLDTSFSMLIGWAINSAIIILAATVFYSAGIKVDSIEQSAIILKPLLGSFAVILFSLAFLFAGFSSSVTAGIAGGSIFSGIFNKDYNQKKVHTRIGIIITLVLGTIVIFFIKDPFKGLIYSQIVLSIQLPITILLQIYLTSSKKVMGKYANSSYAKFFLWIIQIFVTILNIILLYYLLRN